MFYILGFEIYDLYHFTNFSIYKKNYRLMHPNASKFEQIFKYFSVWLIKLISSIILFSQDNFFCTFSFVNTIFISIRTEIVEFTT